MKNFRVINSTFLERKICIFTNTVVTIKNINYSIPYFVDYVNGILHYDTIQKDTLLEIVNNLNNNITLSEFINTHVIPKNFEPTYRTLLIKLPNELI